MIENTIKTDVLSIHPVDISDKISENLQNEAVYSVRDDLENALYYLHIYAENDHNPDLWRVLYNVLCMYVTDDYRNDTRRIHKLARRIINVDHYGAMDAGENLQTVTDDIIKNPLDVINYLIDRIETDGNI